MLHGLDALRRGKSGIEGLRVFKPEFHNAIHRQALVTHDMSFRRFAVGNQILTVTQYAWQCLDQRSVDNPPFMLKNLRRDIRMAAQKKPAPRRISGGCLLYEMNFKRATREATKKPGPTDVCYAHQTHQEYAEQAAYIEANCEAIMDSIRATVATEELMGKLRKGGAL